jgi:hypothetical protein
MVGASAILASAKPIGNALNERAMKTEWVYEVVTVVVTEGAEAKKAQPTAPVYKAPDAPKVTQEAVKVKEQPAPAPVKVKEEAPKPVVVTVWADPKPTHKVVKEYSEKVVVVKPVEPAPAPVYEAPKPVVEKPVEKPVVEEPKTTIKKVVKPSPTRAEPKVTVEASIDTSGLSLDGAYNTVMLAYHNIHRANHSAPALEWDDELAGYAENTANGCVFEHDM